MAFEMLAESAQGGAISVTVSAGIAGVSSEHETLDGLLNRADQALYRAKEAGRNRVFSECGGDLRLAVYQSDTGYPRADAVEEG